MTRSIFTLLIITVVHTYSAWGQFTKKDSIWGSITPERAWWELGYYHLDMQVFPAKKFISGINTVRFTVLDTVREMQIDLQPPMELKKVIFQGRAIPFRSEDMFHYLELPKDLVIGEVYEVMLEYSGHPHESRNPPWSGGVTWDRDKHGNDFIATTCQGDGASIWWPCRDHSADEPDSVLISVRIPDHLMNVSNGRLLEVTKHNDGTATYHWFVSNPINQYGININIGDYVHFSEVYQGERGPLSCDYYVLRHNLGKARKQFRQATMMLKAFEHWFGPYPFYEDGFKLVEAPYLGMEHQSSVTYGNGYKNGYRGHDRSRTGHGHLFDYIIIHEGGHEWFANNITAKDKADLWLHESFTTYSENLYLDYHYGKDTASEYVIGTRHQILNRAPIQGPYGVRAYGSGDMYAKGAAMLHTVRQVIADDELWRQTLRGMNEHFRHQTIESQQLIDYISEKSGRNMSPFFRQFTGDVRIPILQFRRYPGGLEFKWDNCLSDFDMPIDVFIDGVKTRLSPTTQWQRWKKRGISDVRVDRNYYVASQDLSSK